MNGPGRGQGGSAGAQQPLNAPGRDSLEPGRPDSRGPRSATSYRDQPDMNPSKAGAYVASPEFRRKTEAALRREEVPAGYRRQVKDYFDSLRGQ